MKQNITKSTLVVLASAATLFLGSCTSGFEEVNDPREKANAELLGRDNYNVASFMANIQDAAFPQQENEAQMTNDLIGRYLGRYFTYTVGGWSGKSFATFNAPEGWVRWPYRNMVPKIIANFNDVKRLAGDNYANDINYNWALITRAHSFLQMTDIYGPLPLGLDPKNPTAYNSQELIYKQLIADLDQAIAYIDANKVGVVAALKNTDEFYGGDFAKWRRFASSLKLRMAVRMRLAAPDFAKEVAEKAVKEGVIESNSDNLVRYYNPLGIYKTSVEWGDSRMCADLDSYMNGYNDPRLAKYFKPAATQTTRSIIGALAGSNIGNKDIAVKLYSAANVERTSGEPFVTAAEMYFCRAEGALYGWSMNGEAQAMYEAGVKASFEQWGAGDAAGYLANNYSQPMAYNDATGGYGSSQASPSSITIAWDANADKELNLERIITQKWIALFPNGQEGWTEIRRTGYPKIFDIQTSKNGYTLRTPNRVPFDSEEKVNNPAAYAAGVALLGGADNYATPMWWDRTN